MNKNIFKTRILVLFILTVVGCSENKNPTSTDNRVLVHTEKIKQVTYNEEIRSSGILYTKTEAKLSFKKGGIIDRIYVDEGNYVKKGELIASLKLTEINAKVTQAKLAYEKATRDFARVQNLYQDSVATLEQYQDMKTALDIAESNLQIAEFNKKHSRLNAPSNGKILKKLAQEDEMISQGYPVVIFGSTDNNWIFRTSLVDKDVVQLSIGDSANIHFDAFPGQYFKGVVSEAGSMADPFTGTYEIEIRILNPVSQFVSGLVGIVNIQTSNEEQFLQVPVEALIEGNENVGYIYLLKAKNPVRQKINIHHFDDEYLYIINEQLLDKDVITVGVNYINKNTEIGLMD